MAIHDVDLGIYSMSEKRFCLMYRNNIIFQLVPYYIHSTGRGAHTAFTIPNYCHVLTMRRRCRRHSSTHSPFSTPYIRVYTHFPLADFNLMANSTIEHLSSVYTLFGYCCCCCCFCRFFLFFVVAQNIFSPCLCIRLAAKREKCIYGICSVNWRCVLISVT